MKLKPLILFQLAAGQLESWDGPNVRNLALNASVFQIKQVQGILYCYMEQLSKPEAVLVQSGRLCTTSRQFPSATAAGRVARWSH